MRLLTLVPSEYRSIVTSAIPHGWSELCPRSLTETAVELARNRFDLVLLEIDGCREDRLIPLIEGLRSSDATVILLTLLRSAEADRVLDIASAAPVELVIENITQSAQPLVETLQAGSHPSAQGLLFHRIAGRLKRLPATVRAASLDLFAPRSTILSVERFVEASARHRRTVERDVQSVGIVTVDRLVHSVALARTWPALGAKSLSIEGVASAVACSARTFNERHRNLIGLPPRRARRLLSTAQFVERLVDSLCG